MTINRYDMHAIFDKVREKHPRNFCWAKKSHGHQAESIQTVVFFPVERWKLMKILGYKCQDTILHDIPFTISLLQSVSYTNPSSMSPKTSLGARSRRIKKGKWAMTGWRLIT